MILLRLQHMDSVAYPDGEDDVGDHNPGPQRAPLPPPDVLIAMETGVPAE